MNTRRVGGPVSIRRAAIPSVTTRTASDEMAIAFIKHVRQAGLQVPADLSVIGFDGINFSYYCEPTLTTIHQPFK